MPSIRSKINGHSKKILQPKPTDLLMKRLCLTSSILYQATMKCSDSKYKHKRYKGIGETTCKKYANYKKLFNLIKTKNDTTLSIEYWNLKQKQQALRLTWEIKVQYSTRLITPL